MKRSWLLVKTRNFFNPLLLRKVREKYKGMSLAEKCRQALRMLNIHIKMGHRLRRDLKRIKKDSGLIISNHPSDIEQLIIPVICDGHRSFKIIVQKGLFKNYKKVGRQNFMLAALPYLEKAAPKAIHKGHLVALFPSGGREHKFRRGFVKIVERLSPKTMVYCLHVDEAVIKKNFSNKLRQMIYYSGLGSEIFFSKWLNINRLLPVRVVNVEGQMVRAADFQKVMKSQQDDIGKARAATEFYDELFKRKRRRLKGIGIKRKLYLKNRS